jgi:hypothetical protein
MSLGLEPRPSSLQQRTLTTTLQCIMPCSPTKVTDVSVEHKTTMLRVEQAEQDTSLPPAVTLVTCSACWTLQMEVICSSRTLVDFQGPTHYPGRQYSSNTMLLLHSVFFRGSFLTLKMKAGSSPETLVR